MNGFAQRIADERSPSSNEADVRKALAKQLIDNGQFLIGEQPKVVRNRLSTDLLVFPSDLNASHSDLLNEKINSAIEYAASFTDVERLNALQYFPGAYKPGEDAQGRWYLTLGLYLYFADECSRKNPQTTFLTALREADASLPGDAGFNPIKLATKFVRALEITGIESHTNLNILEDWFRTGTYTIAGNLHRATGEKGEVEGAYAQLARHLVSEYHHLHEKGIIVGVDEAISYALGNKEHMRQLQRDEETRLNGEAPPKTEEEIQKECDKAAYRHLEETLNSTQGLLAEHVTKGNDVRRQRIRDIIHNRESPLFSQTEIAEAEQRQKDQRAVAEKILSHFPPEALELMLRERQTVVYDDHTDIRRIFPPGDIPGQRREQSDTSRKSIAMRMERYRAAFFSNGYHKDADTVTDDIKYKRVAQSSLHELMHVAYGRMTDEEKQHLGRLADKVSEELRFNDTRDFVMPDGYAYFYKFFTAGGKIPDRTETLEVRSLPEILDYKSNLYNGYRQDPEKPATLDTRREEVICNTFGFIHTEFNKREDENNLVWHPPKELDAIREFAQAVDDTFKHVVERLRETTTLPELSNGRGVG